MARLAMDPRTRAMMGDAEFMRIMRDVQTNPQVRRVLCLEPETVLVSAPHFLLRTSTACALLYFDAHQ